MTSGPDTPATLRAAAATRDILGEGPVWDEEGEVLWWVDIAGAAIQRIRPTDGRYDRWTMPERVTALALRRRGGLVLALSSGFAFFDPAAGAGGLERLPALASLLPGQRLNDGRCDSAGRFWCAAMREQGEQADASLYCLEADGRASPRLGGLMVGNSLSWGPGDRTMYLSDTPTGTIHAFDYDPASGAMRNRRPFHTPGPDVAGLPDGGTVDADGHLWSARWEGQGLARLRPDGTLDRFVTLPARRVTCCAFGGPGLRTLYVTSASEGLSEAEAAAQPWAGMLMAFEPGVAGLPARRFAG
ncbi:MAG: araB 2 [Roseomonas sp.]|nr:araB 2 [Roseomonas sp.]